VWQNLRDAGIDPVPRRTGPTWKQLLTEQVRGILATDYVHTVMRTVPVTWQCVMTLRERDRPTAIL
jgi:hypothetical protein